MNYLSWLGQSLSVIATLGNGALAPGYRCRLRGFQAGVRLMKYAACISAPAAVLCLLDAAFWIPIERVRGDVAGAQYAKCAMRTILNGCLCCTTRLKSHKEP